MSGINNFVNAKDWIDDQSKHFTAVLLNQSSITSTKPLGTFIFGKNILKGNFSFSLSCGKMEKMGVGIIDQKHRLSEYITDQKEMIRYYNDGQLYVAGQPTKIQGKGFNTGDLVTVSGDI